MRMMAKTMPKPQPPTLLSPLVIGRDTTAPLYSQLGPTQNDKHYVTMFPCVTMCATLLR